jgi:hypothetical protein
MALACGVWGIASAASADPAGDAAARWAERIAAVQSWKLAIAASATLLLAVDWRLRATGRAAVFARVRAGALVALALATLFAWWHPYRGELGAWLHERDAFHYYVGSKYFDELGYTRLYRCVYVADVEAGLSRQLAGTRIRNLETNVFEDPVHLARDPAPCKKHFSATRWREFERDVAFFRAALPRAEWFRLRGDHGYNPPPAWTMLGSLLTHTGPASVGQLYALTAIDPALLALMFASVAWAFGWRTLCIALIYWGTNQPASWDWVGGSIVRFDWLAASVAGVCCLARGRPATAGALLAWAAGVRIFPGAFAAGVALAAALRMLRERTLVPTPAQRRFAAGFAGALAAIVALSSLSVGPSSWIDFVRNSQTHLTTDSVNRVGLRPLLAYSPASSLAAAVDGTAPDPYERWREARSATFESRRALFFLLLAGYLALLAWAIDRQPDWVAAVLGIGVVPIALELGSYYYGFLLVFACLAVRREPVGVLAMLLAAASWSFGTWGGPGRDGVIAAIAASIVLFVYTVTIVMGTRRGAARRPRRARARA